MASESRDMNKRLTTIIERVLEQIPVDLERFRSRDPFKTLVAVILSQRTSRENVRAALREFEKRFNSVSDVASADIKSIGKAIKRAGLWRQKAPRIKMIAKQLLKMGGLERILSLPYEEARKILSSMKGIGPKTADVYLMIMRRDPVLPIDTHIFRIMRRLGIADEKDDYEALRRKLESATPPEHRMRAHLALIEFGRTICKARSPRCQSCFLADICPYARRIRVHEI